MDQNRNAHAQAQEHSQKKGGNQNILTKYIEYFPKRNKSKKQKSKKENNVYIKQTTKTKGKNKHHII